MNEVVREFLLETHENLAQLDLDLVTLEKDPTERETLARVFRTLHTVKGTAGFLGLPKLQAVAHAAENLLSRLRAGELVFEGEIASTLLKVVDVVREMLASIEASENEGAGDYGELIQTLARLTQGTNATRPKPEKPASPAPSTAVAPTKPAPSQPVTKPSPKPAKSRTPPPVAPPPAIKPPPPSKSDAPQPFASDVPSFAIPPTLIQEGPQARVAAALASEPSPPVARQSLVKEPTERVEPRAPAGAAALAADFPPAMAGQPVVTEPTEPVEPRAPAVSDSSIRVDVGLLDKLMNLVGELVLARNQIIQFSAAQEDNAFLGPVQRLNLLTTELQAGVMKTRMQPIGNIWTKFPRLVRDIAVACNKQVRLEMEGKETELDRSIIESIRDPFTHLVRNSIDHGIEMPADRQARGKLPEGRLKLRAFHEGGKVIIEIADDGAGIDPARVRDKAISVKLITPEQAARMSERELINLIFLPGFSTAERVSNFSGRGVGMDVVRTNVEKIGGSVDVDSRLGQGTTVRMKIPLTLAIIPALTVTSGGDRYAIPQVSLLELVRLEGEQAQRGIERIHAAPVYRLRGNLLPVVYLREQLQVKGAAEASDDLNLVVLQADDRQFGLVVDEIHDTEEIVVKPLQKQLKGIGIFAGATIMGDGKVALILDVLGLAQRANVVSEVRERGMTATTSSSGIIAGDRQTVLVCATRDGSRIGIPLSLVARLEDFPRLMLERTGNSHVVQYRDEILPLIDVAQMLDQCNKDAMGSSVAERGEAASVQVVVHAVPRGHVGLVVASIVDIVEEAIVTRARARRAGVLYTAVLQGQVTEFIDIEKIIRTFDPELFEQPSPA
jgi:two-component system chemotaxis sensor kinase CheA